MFEGREYAIAEHAFQAQKTSDEFERGRIAAAATPTRAKRLGRNAGRGPHATPHWHSGVKDEVMWKVIVAKARAAPRAHARHLAARRARRHRHATAT